MDIPSKAKLWWIGLGIEVIQNNIASPQENGIVECLQGTCHRWVNPSQLTNIKELQGQLDEMSSFQRNLYQMPKRSYMTRIECYPELEMNPRKYEPNHFNMALVDQYLANQIWQRRIKQKGSTHFFGLEIQIGKQFGNTDTFITFDPEQRQWVFRNRQGYFLKSSSIGIPCQKDIKEFAVMSKN